MSSGIEIAQKAKMRKIADVARERLGIHEDDLENYGRYKAKVSFSYLNKLKKVGVKMINLEFKNNDPFFNINTKEDLEKAKEIIKNND